MNDQTMGCPVCHGTDLEQILEISGVPVFNNVLWDTRAEALNAPRGDLILTFCHRCGHFFNRAFDPALIAYTQAYENSLYGSPRFQQYAKDLAARLKQKFDLDQKTIVEVGCGQGNFLYALCAGGLNKGIGFDPSLRPDSAGISTDADLTLIPEVFSGAGRNDPADLYVARHVLEHLPEPLEFLRAIQSARAAESRAGLYVEVPNVDYTLMEGGIWDLIYEHYSYFSPSSLSYLLRAAGFEVSAIYPAFGGQFLCAEAHTGEPKVARTEATAPTISSAESRSRLATFGSAFQEKIIRWDEILQRQQAEEQTIVIWGTGSKGVSFLNHVKASAGIEYAVDINPKKQGKYVAGSGQKIIAAEELIPIKPDTVIVMNPLYLEEISQTLSQLNLKPELVIA